MKVRRYDRQLRDPDLRPLYRLVWVRVLNRALAAFGGEAMPEPSLPWWLQGCAPKCDARREFVEVAPDCRNGPRENRA